ncbi:hypothetical protein Hanom_Chr14g01309331 [Helianthus anomalus]
MNQECRSYVVQTKIIDTLDTLETVDIIKSISKMSFPSLRFGHFCDFSPKVGFFASGSKSFEIVAFLSLKAKPRVTKVTINCQTPGTKMARFRTCWIQMRKNKNLDESHKNDRTSGIKMAFYSKLILNLN